MIVADEAPPRFSRTGPRPSCLCNACSKCRARERARAAYHGVRLRDKRTSTRVCKGIALRRAESTWAHIALELGYSNERAARVSILRAADDEEREALARAAPAPRPVRTRMSAREYHLRHKYGIGLADYNTLLAEQCGVCAVCGEGPDDQALHVDHDHETGRVRCLLCYGCNTAIGLMRDRPAVHLAAARYLERVKA